MFSFFTTSFFIVFISYFFHFSSFIT